MVPKTGRLLGKTEATVTPPSDHYGVEIQFELMPVEHSPAPILPRSLPTAWSTCSPLTQDSLVALVLDSEQLPGSPFYDPHSTLPLPHITLLHGFVELPNDESRNLAFETLRSAIGKSVDDPCPQLLFDELTVFEHHASATLVAQPAVCSWLRNLYEALRLAFPQCDHQESRFEGGWKPHGKSSLNVG